LRRNFPFSSTPCLSPRGITNRKNQYLVNGQIKKHARPNDAQRIPCFDSYQVIITWMSSIKNVTMMCYSDYFKVACVTGRRKGGKGSKRLRDNCEERRIFARCFFPSPADLDACHAGYFQGIGLDGRTYPRTLT